MKNTNVLQAILLGGVMILSAGCVRESYIDDKYRPAGSVISFSPSTGYENGTGVRTEYSGELFGDSPKYERINWKENDPITIVYKHGSAVARNYKVTSVQSSTDETSTASIGVASGSEPLTWNGGDGSHVFIAMYPSQNFKGNSSPSIATNGVVSGRVLAEQAITQVGSSSKFQPAMEYAYMVAGKRIDAASTESQVTLPFIPAVTAFEFKLRCKDDDTRKVTSAKLSSETAKLTGTFTFKITNVNAQGANWNRSEEGDNPTTISDGGSSVTVNFPTGGITLPASDSPATEYLDFTMFALPIPQTGLSLTLTFDDGTKKTLPLKNAGTDVFHEFSATKKHIITNTSVPGEWEYIISADSPAELSYLGSTEAGASEDGIVRSYRQKGSEKVAVAWEVEGYYYDEECTNPVSPADNWISGFRGIGSASAGTGEGSATGENVTFDYAGAIVSQTETISEASQALNALVAGSELGSAAAPLNLSNPKNMGSNSIEESANSYIVNKVGYYCIPLVMGNSIKGNINNPVEEQWKGFDGLTTDNQSVHTRDWRVKFKNYLDQEITDPWLKNQGGGNPVSAEVVWEDVEGLVKTDADYNIPGAIYGSGQWLRFRIPAEREGPGIINGQNEPRQGNAVIAVRDAQGRIMWAYHIWVTDYVPKNYDGYSSSNDDIITYGPIIVKGWDLDRLVSRWGPEAVYGENGHEAVSVSKSFNYRFMGRNLGFVEYGQTITTSYTPNSNIYVRLRQPESNLTATILIVQGTHSDEVFSRGMGAPTYTYARIVPHWPATNVDYQNPLCYGKAGTYQKLEIDETITMGTYIQNSDKHIVNPTQAAVLQGITVAIPTATYRHGENIQHWGNPYDIENDPPIVTGGALYEVRPYKNIPSGWTSKMYPSNLWQAHSQLTLDVNNQYSFGEDWISGFPEAGGAYIFTWDTDYFAPNEKTIYDPCPVGYWVGCHASSNLILGSSPIGISYSVDKPDWQAWANDYMYTHRLSQHYSMAILSPCKARTVKETRVTTDGNYYVFENGNNEDIVIPGIGILTSGGRTRAGSTFRLSHISPFISESRSYIPYNSYYQYDLDSQGFTLGITTMDQSACSLRPFADVKNASPFLIPGFAHPSDLADYYNNFVPDE